MQGLTGMEYDAVSIEHSFAFFLARRSEIEVENMMRMSSELDPQKT